MSKPRPRNPPNAEVLASVREAESISEAELARIEADPEFRRMMKDSEDDMRHGRYITHKEAIRLLRAASGNHR